jgi:hypothetical protein
VNFKPFKSVPNLTIFEFLNNSCYSLENFRNRDFHFVLPQAFPCPSRESARTLLVECGLKSLNSCGGAREDSAYMRKVM